MLTPDFKLSQTPTHIIVVLRLPYVKISSCEFYIESYKFKFYLKPYILGLEFYQELKYVYYPSKATYYHEKHLLYLHLEKKNKDEHFENLNLLASVLGKGKKYKYKKKEKNGRTLVEVVGGQGGDVDSVSNGQYSTFGYGFCGNYANVFDHLEEYCYEIMSFNPKYVSKDDRYELSRKLAESYFDLDAYLFDNEDNEDIPQIIKSKASKKTLQYLMYKYSSKYPQNYQYFKNMMKIPNKYLLIPEGKYKELLYQIVSIVLCFLYYLECMDGDFSVYSAKTINNTSAILSCSVNYNSLYLKDIVIDTARRCIVYSLYKSVDLFTKSINNAVEHLNKDFIWAVLAEIKSMFHQSDPRYLLNTIFLDDYLIYCSKKIKDYDLKPIIYILKNIEITEEMLDLPLEYLYYEYTDEQKDEYETYNIYNYLKKYIQENEEKINSNSFQKKGPLIVELNSTENYNDNENKDKNEGYDYNLNNNYNYVSYNK